MENWLWILILIFFVFRLLLKAGQKIGQAPPSSREREGGDRPARAAEDSRVFLPESRGRREEDEEPRRGDFRNPLLKVLEEMAGVQQPRPIIPPPPPGRIVRETKTPAPEIAPPPEKPTPRPEFKAPLFLPEESGPDPESLIFSSHPVLQGIIISEILGPPLALRDKKTLASQLF